MTGDDAQPASLIEVYVRPDGAYAGADGRALDVLGYSEEELRALPPGGLAARDSRQIARLWACFASGTCTAQPPRQTELVTRDGRVLRATLLEILRNRQGGEFTSRLVLEPSGGSGPAVHEVLAQWRAAERRLASLAPGDARRGDLEHRVEELRALYQRLSRPGARAPDYSRTLTGRSHG